MAEPLYPHVRVRAVRDADRLEVLGFDAGPAGVSAVELSDGSVWEVDHARPELLVGLDVDGTADPSRSRLLVAAFGGDGVLFVSDGAAASGSEDPVGVSPWESRGVRTGPAERSAAQAGRLVLLADLADDEALDPLARIAAAVELATAVDRGGPGADLLAPLVGAGLDAADHLAEHVDDPTLHWLDPKLRARLMALIRGAPGSPGGAGHPGGAGRTGAGRDGLEELARRLDPGRSAGVELLAAELNTVADSESFAAEAFPMRAPVPAAAQAPTAAPGGSSVPDGVDVTRTDPGRVVVTVMRSDRPRWVRVARADGLVLLAQSRLHRDGLVDRADVVVPDHVDTADLVVSVVDADDLSHPTGPLEAVRAAVRAGRHAARASRLGDRVEHVERWERCAQLWEAAGDLDRADRARDLAGPRGAVPMMAAPITDEIVALTSAL